MELAPVFSKSRRLTLFSVSPSLRCQQQQIFTFKKLEDISPSTHNMEAPIVIRQEFQLVNVDDG